MCDRITPACAGRTSIRAADGASGKDHPRVCGKNCVHSTGVLHIEGSPPRVREELRLAIRRIQRWGITPACAGRTYRLPSHSAERKDHPRVCGKNVNSGHGYIPREGSPPRVREELLGVLPDPLEVGITPACAGRTVKPEINALYVRDHPRVCGKNSNMI